MSYISQSELNSDEREVKETRPQQDCMDANNCSRKKKQFLTKVICFQSLFSSGSIRNNSQNWIAEMIVSTILFTLILFSRERG